MTFGNPLWLLGLIPWAGAVAYLLWGRSPRAAVPFLDLWLGPVVGPRHKHKVAVPPVAVALSLLALFFAVVAAAGPRMAWGSGGPPLTVILDRGASMSARGVRGPRFAEAAAAFAEAVSQHVGGRRVELHVVPPVTGRLASAQPTGSADMQSTGSIQRTAMDTSLALDAAVRARAGSPGPLVVISDRHLRAAGADVIQMAPDTPVQNAGIVAVAVRDSPRPQVMVSIRNNTPLATARVEVTTAGRTAALDVAVARAGAAPVEAFLDLPEVGDVVEVRLGVDDAFEGDNVAWLVRDESWPRIEAHAAIPPELGRAVEVYSRFRPPGESSKWVRIVSDPADLNASVPGVVVLAHDFGGPAAETAPAGPAAEVSPHPVTHSIERGFQFDSASVSSAVPNGWTPVVQIGGRVAVAVREGPARQVWVGFDSTEWARRPEYVVYWANVFDWVGGSAGPEFRGFPIGALGGQWQILAGGNGAGELGLWPGLYQRSEDGARRAVNAVDVQFPAPAAIPDWRPRFAAALERGRIDTPAAPALMVLAAGCLALAVALWNRGRSARRPDTSAEVSGAGASRPVKRPEAVGTS